MIGMLRGNVAFVNTSFVIVDVSGVGYKVLLSSRALSAIQSVGDSVHLYTHTHVREDVLELYGFSAIEDLKVFEMLIGVSGVGCKSALGIFSIGTRPEIINAVIKGDVSFFTAAPRLGKKNAQKIIIELKGKLGDASDIDLGVESGVESRDVVEALRSFGFSTREAEDALRLSKGEGETTAEKIRLALKRLGK